VCMEPQMPANAKNQTQSHTPGPWQTGAGACHTVFAAYKVDGHQRQIAHCATQSGRVDYDSRESFANARLIAAAPELLEALRAMVDHVLHYAATPYAHSDAARDAANARAAIAKATGQA
jgi:hypothetical protein